MKDITIYSLGDMNVCTEFHDISLKTTKVIGLCPLGTMYICTKL